MTDQIGSDSGDSVPVVRKRTTSFRVLVALLPALAFIGVLWGRAGAQRIAGRVGQQCAQLRAPTAGRQRCPPRRGPERQAGGDQLLDILVNPLSRGSALARGDVARLSDQGIVFLGVNIKDAESDARRFVEEFDITYPTVRDLDQSLTRDFGVKGLPETFFVDHRWTFIDAISGAKTGDKQGTVILGAISQEELISNVEILLRRMSSTDEEEE